MRSKFVTAFIFILLTASVVYLQTQNVKVTNFPLFIGIAQVGTLNDVDATITNSSLAVTGTFWPVTQPISGTIGVNNFPSTYPVTGTFFQATQPVSLVSLPSLATGSNTIGAISNTTFASTQSGTWNIGTITTLPAIAITNTSFIANAGTNLNTSLLALESGGNLAALVAKDYATQTTLALIKAKTDNIDVLLSTRTKPADAQHTIIDSGSISNTTFAVTSAGLTNLDVALSTRLKPADTLAGITIVGTLTSITNAVTIKADTAANQTNSLKVSEQDQTTVTNNPIGNVSLGTTLGKTSVLKTGTLATTTTTADQVILTYTVTAGKTLYVMNYDISFGLTTAAITPNCGNVSLESPAGTKLDTNRMSSVGNQASISQQYPEPIGIAAGTVFRFVVTPCITTSTTWAVSFAGYEK